MIKSNIEKDLNEDSYVLQEHVDEGELVYGLKL